MSPRSSRNSQQGESSFGSLFDSDGQKSRLGFASATVIPLALRTAKHDAASSIRTISGRIRRTEDGNNRDTKRRSQMQRSRVAADKERSAASECDKLRQ